MRYFSAVASNAGCASNTNAPNIPETGDSCIPKTNYTTTAPETNDGRASATDGSYAAFISKLEEIKKKNRSFSNELRNNRDEFIMNVIDNSDEKSALEISEKESLAIMDNLKNKSKQARKCGNWFAYRYRSLQNMCGCDSRSYESQMLLTSNYSNVEDLCDKMLRDSAGLLACTDLIDEYLEINKGYVNHLTKGFVNHSLSDLHKRVIDLEDEERKFTELTETMPRFERSKNCNSEHRTPFCRDCGWSSQWIKTFKKKGVYIKEAVNQRDTNVWFNYVKNY